MIRAKNCYYFITIFLRFLDFMMQHARVYSMSVEDIWRRQIPYTIVNRLSFDLARAWLPRFDPDPWWTDYRVIWANVFTCYRVRSLNRALECVRSFRVWIFPMLHVILDNFVPMKSDIGINVSLEQQPSNINFIRFNFI